MRNLCLVIAAFAFVPACVTGAGDDDGPPPGDDDGPDGGTPPPEEWHEPACNFDECGVPGTDPCCDGTTCVNFGALERIECAVVMEGDAECDSGCVLELDDGTQVCSPAEYCQPGSVYPDLICDRADACDWWDDTSACTNYYRQCISTHSASEQLAWMNQVATCLSYSYCSDFESCMYSLDYCW